jgi:hypothetical protein
MRSPSASRRSVDEEGQCRSYLTQDVYVEVEAFVARLRWVCHLPLTVGRAGGNARKSVACHVASTSTGQAAAISLRWTSTYPLQCSRYYNVPYFPSTPFPRSQTITSICNVACQMSLAGLT